MKTIVENIDCRQLTAEKIETAARILREGGLVAFPTETVYGLGGDALNPKAAGRIYEAKGRPSDNPLIVHIADLKALDRIVSEIPDKAARLGEAFWPGPLTMIFLKTDLVPYETTGGLETVAVRMPNHPVALALIRESTGYIAAPSANTSGRPSPTTAEHVKQDLDGRIPMIVDGGPVGIGIESTIVDFSEEPPVILRPGCITKEMLEKVIGKVRMDPGLIKQDENVRPKAPGMKYRHYAPQAELLLVSGEEKKVIQAINGLVKEAEAQGKKAGVIGTEETCRDYGAGIVKSIGSRESEESVARHLYGILREFDELGVDVIYSECFAEEGIGQAVMNRMKKAAGHRIWKV